MVNATSSLSKETALHFKMDIVHAKFYTKLIEAIIFSEDIGHRNATTKVIDTTALKNNLESTS